MLLSVVYYLAMFSFVENRVLGNFEPRQIWLPMACFTNLSKDTEVCYDTIQNEIMRYFFFIFFHFELSISFCAGEFRRKTN